MQARSCTLVLVGPSGQGKSSTGNSILGRKAFSVKHIYSGEPPLCRSEEKTLADGTIWKVIDTPDNLLDSTDELNEEEFGELVCGRDLQAFLVVFSLRSVFLEEEQVAYLERLRDVFGEEIFLHTVVVFTNAGVLEEDGVTLDDYLQSRPKLKDLLGFCQDRRVLLENRSADATKKQSQVENLWHYVGTAVQHNGGPPYKYEGTRRPKVGEDIPESSKSREGKVDLESASSFQTEVTKVLEDLCRLNSRRVDKLESQVAGVEKEINELLNMGMKELLDRVWSLEGTVHNLFLTTNQNSIQTSTPSAAGFDNRSSRCPAEGHAYGYSSSGRGADPFHPDPHRYFPSAQVQSGGASSGGGESYDVHDTDERLLAANVAQGLQYASMTSSSSPFPDGGGNQDPECKCSRKDQRRQGRRVLHQQRLWGPRST